MTNVLSTYEKLFYYSRKWLYSILLSNPLILVVFKLYEVLNPYTIPRKIMSGRILEMMKGVFFISL